MDQIQARRLVNRICAGKHRIGDFCIKGLYKTLVILAPTLEQRLIADEIYDEVFYEAIGSDVYSTEDCIEIAKVAGIWSNEQEDRLSKIPKDVEEMKILIYQEFNKPTLIEGIRRNLRAAESTHTQLLCQKYYFDYLSAENLARNIRYYYILSSTSYYDNGKKIFNRVFWRDSISDSFLANLINVVNSTQIMDKDYRYLVRNEPWKSIWLAGKEASKIFNIPSIEMSDEQRTIIGWSKLYDSVYEAYERPTISVINDDDALDGWMAFVNRNKNEELKQKNNENFTSNEKIKNAGEVYMLNQKHKEAFSSLSKEDRQGIYDMNSVKSKGVIQQRDNFLKKVGKAHEQHLPDVKSRLMQEMARAGIESVKKRG